MGCLQSLPNLLNELRRLEHYLCAPHDPLVNFSPTNRGPTLPSIKELKGRHANTDVIVVDVRKRGQGKVGVLAPTEIYDARPKHIIECQNGLFTLLIRLWKISSTKM